MIWKRCVLLLMCAGFAHSLFAQGGLMVTPQRVVFEGRERAQSVTLFNRSNARVTYRLYFTEKRMTEDGLLDDLTDQETGLFSSSLVRFSPRRVTLGPGESQKVRLLLRRPADLAEGEYRSHLVFRYSPTDGGHNLESFQLQDREVGVRLTPLFGASIPIIVRQGKLASSVQIADHQFRAGSDDAPPQLQLSFQREGNCSVYGDITARFLPDGGEPLQVGYVRGMAIYTELEARDLLVSLTPPEDVPLRGGRLIIEYASNDREQVWATSEITLPR